MIDPYVELDWRANAYAMAYRFPSYRPHRGVSRSAVLSLTKLER